MERIRAQLMQNKNLYNPLSFQADKNGATFGDIQGIPVGERWETRHDLYNSRIHRKTYAGISGSRERGAYSVVLSGAYEDDLDEGETFVYTGTGGRKSDDASWGGAVAQTEDQTFDHPDNAALRRSAETKYPVRVVRGANGESEFSPREGYRYDGLYIVEEAFLAKGKSGYAVCKFRFRRVKEQAPLPTY